MNVKKRTLKIVLVISLLPFVFPIWAAQEGGGGDLPVGVQIVIALCMAAFASIVVWLLYGILFVIITWFAECFKKS